MASYASGDDEWAKDFTADDASVWINSAVECVTLAAEAVRVHHTYPEQLKDVAAADDAVANLAALDTDPASLTYGPSVSPDASIGSPANLRDRRSRI